MTRKTKADIEARIVESILNALNEGIVPWRKPWKSLGGFPANLVTGKPYRGINPFILHATAMVNGYQSRYWLTFNQARKLKGKVRKGEKATAVVFWKRLEVKDKDNPGETKMISMLRYYLVFNADQCEGLSHKRLTEESEAATGGEFDPIADAESIWQGFKDRPNVIDYPDACYWQGKDEIGMPKPELFDTPEDYYATLFHEGIHSTGHKSRLNSDEILHPDRSFGNPEYAKGELVAEIGAAMLCGIAGIEKSKDSTAAYIDHWLGKIRKDPSIVIDAARISQKATDHILGSVFDPEPESASEDIVTQ